MYRPLLNPKWNQTPNVKQKVYTKEDQIERWTFGICLYLSTVVYFKFQVTVSFKLRY